MQPGNCVSEKQDCAVIIIGGGPCGLTLAIELGRRGIPVDPAGGEDLAGAVSRPPTPPRPAPWSTTGGWALPRRCAPQGLPPDYPTDIAYFTRYTKHELARFSLPSARAAREMVRTLTGSWSAAELPHRVSQMFVEDVLRGRSRAHARPCRSGRAGG